MASKDRDLSTRMSAEDYRLMREIAAKLFKEHKIEISHTIKTVYPFFEILRDRGLITDEKYKESRKSCENQSSVPKVVYDVLSELEEKYHLPFLEILFSKVIMKNYPGVNNIWKDFRDVILKEICYQENDEERRAKSHNTQLSLEQGTGEKSYPCLSWLFLDQSNHTESMGLIKSPTSGNIHCKRVRSPEASSGFSAEEKHPEAGSSAVRSGADQEGPVDLGKSATSQKAKKKRWSKKHKEEFVDFDSDILPVTCGELKGMLQKNKLEEGSTVKCIKTEDGNWLTPQEFEAAGGYKSSSNWKNTVRCGGKTLKHLMEEEKLPIPPRKYGKNKKLKKPDVCKICRDGENLLCCDTCSRSFHGYCHLPPVQPERHLRRPWSCTFCRIKESSGSQQCHKESEVLARPMGPEEQLKCQFLLLEIYCHSDNDCSEKMLHDKYTPETFECMKNLQMLNEIEKKLREQCYPNVEGFMRDMRLIFQNHRAFNKCKDLFLLGITLEKKFEKNFTEVFAIQKIKQEHTDNKIKRKNSA